ncbi:hypothetical protein BJX99DRAFT_236907 [Aspergillus californicus]
MEQPPEALSTSPGSNKVSRRSTACIQCQKQKVRCVLSHRRPPCRRCAAKGLPCLFKNDPPPIVSNSEHHLLSSLVSDIAALHTALNEVRAGANFQAIPPLKSTIALSELTSGVKPSGHGRDNVPSHLQAADINAELIDENIPTPTRHETSDSLAPMQSLYQITHLRSLRPQHGKENFQHQTVEPHDLISRGLLSISDAELLVNQYLRHTDHYLYGIASDYSSLTQLRRSSQLLLTAILTVAAVQSQNGHQLYRICYAELRARISDFMFSPSVTLEDIRGLCIACFWLSDISWSISSLAIRRAIELDLHKSFSMVSERLQVGETASNAVENKERKRLIDSLRLWLLLCICDQHLAILYGRPATLRDDEAVQNWAVYLALQQAEPTDVRILSQVALVQILRSASDTFGQDPKRRVPTVLKPQLDSFNQQIDQWVTYWLHITKEHSVIGSYPSKAIILHHHFSKLLISSLVFRGIGRESTEGTLPSEFNGLALMAVESAKSVLALTVNDADIVSAFIAIPHYYHTMIAFACSFLLKTSKHHKTHIGLDSSIVPDLVRPVIGLCNDAKCTSYHLAHWIGKGLGVLLVDYFKPFPQACQPMGNLTSDAREIPFYPDYMQQDPDPRRGLPDDNPESDINNSIWETASAMMYNDSMATSLYDGFNLHAGLSGSILHRGLDSQDDPANGASVHWDPSAPYASVEHLGLGLL